MASRADLHVRILMATWNGARHLPSQLDSFLAQEHRNWSLILRDDGSQDATLEHLDSFRRAHPDRRIFLLPGTVDPSNPPGQRGAAANFLRLLDWADPDPGTAAALTAFSDQDDVWLPHKLSRAIALLGDGAAPEAPPAVYASRSIHTDADLQPQGFSTLHPRPPTFANALVQNVLGGNTIVLNPAATALVRRTCPAALLGDGVPFHDWWVYLVAAGAGARIINDAEPSLLYRQHGRNVLGAHVGLGGALARMGEVARGGWRGWIDRNLAALSGVADILTPAHRETFEAFASLRRTPSPRARLAALDRLGIHRQSRAGDMVIRALAIAGRL
jgi:glycosyltransferase involved in cell wall biosynthesis